MNDRTAGSRLSRKKQVFRQVLRICLAEQALKRYCSKPIRGVDPIARTLEYDARPATELPRDLFQEK